VRSSGLPEGGTFPEASLERVLELDVVARVEGSGRTLRGDDGLGVIQPRLDLRCLSARQVDLRLIYLIQS
jgi:hypothetical protein